MSKSKSEVEQYHSTVITKGLKAALAESSIDKPISNFDDAHIKLNKLMYIAASEKGILDELQHSWHIYGSDLGDLVPSTQSVKPRALQDLPDTQKPDRPSVNQSSEDLPSEDDFVEVFSDISLGNFSSLKEILRADRVELLDEFYTEYSEDIEEYHELYAHNVELQEILAKDRTWIDVNEIGEQEYNRVNELTIKLRDQFFNHEEFQEDQVSELGLELDNTVQEMFLDFLELVDDVYFYLSRRSEPEIKGDASYVIDLIDNFYRDKAWKAVTEIISFHTIRGPRQSSLQYGAKEAIRSVDANYQVKFDWLVSECISSGIIPVEKEDPEVELLSAGESLEQLDSCDLVRN